MEKVNEANYLSIVFYDLVEREEHLIKKYGFYLENLKQEKSKNTLLINLIREFKMEAQEHIKTLKDKMIKLNLKG